MLKDCGTSYTIIVVVLVACRNKNNKFNYNAIGKNKMTNNSFFNGEIVHRNGVLSILGEEAGDLNRSELINAFMHKKLGYGECTVNQEFSGETVRLLNFFNATFGFESEASFLLSNWAKKLHTTPDPPPSTDEPIEDGDEPQNEVEKFCYNNWFVTDLEFF